jgi:hypothetical protein
MPNTTASTPVLHELTDAELDAVTGGSAYDPGEGIHTGYSNANGRAAITNESGAPYNQGGLNWFPETGPGYGRATAPGQQ